MKPFPLCLFLCQCALAAVAGGEHPNTTKNPITPSPVPAQEDAWQFTLSPYGWLASLDGILGVRGQPFEVDIPAADILENLDMAAMLSFEARRGRWGGWLDFGYLQMSVDADPSGPRIDYLGLTMEQVISEVSLFYRVLEGERGYLDLFAGARYTYISGEFSLDPTAPGGNPVDLYGSQQWIDPLVGLRAGYRFSDRWYAVAKGDIGGFGASSDLIWQVYGALGYHLTKSGSTTLELGYRHMMIDYQNGGFTYDMDLGGPMISLGFAF